MKRTKPVGGLLAVGLLDQPPLVDVLVELLRFQLGLARRHLERECVPVLLQLTTRYKLLLMLYCYNLNYCLTALLDSLGR